MDIGILAQLITAAVVSTFAAVKAYIAVVAFFKKKE